MIGVINGLLRPMSMTPGGGGIPPGYHDTSQVDATAGDVASGKKIVDANGAVLTGTHVCGGGLPYFETSVVQAAGSWTITHNLNSQKLMFAIYMDVTADYTPWAYDAISFVGFTPQAMWLDEDIYIGDKTLTKNPLAEFYNNTARGWAFATEWASAGAVSITAAVKSREVTIIFDPAANTPNVLRLNSTGMIGAAKKYFVRVVDLSSIL